MFSILLHSSKTMRSQSSGDYQPPVLLEQAQELAGYIQSLTPQQLEACMSLSTIKASQTYELWQKWSTKPTQQLPAIDAFIGDIYSGLQVQSFTADDRAYANTHLFILSGLYGVLRGLDSIAPYRLEMGYKLPDEPYRNMYTFWGNRIAQQLPQNTTIINLSAVEYTKVVLPHLHHSKVISPKFLTRTADGEAKLVVVHAKIARGAFARWLIKERLQTVAKLKDFSDLNYRYDEQLSTPEQPVFVCETFGGLGLSVRLS